MNRLHLVFLLGACGVCIATLHAGSLKLEDFRPHGGNWQSAGEVKIDPDNAEAIVFTEGDTLIVNGALGKTTNLFTQIEHGDVEVHVEYFIPSDSNSGIYFQGRYEVQIRDSYDRGENVRHADAGGIYQRWDEDREPQGWGGVPPRVNAAKPAGEWQTLDIIFRAPRFDESGHKVEDAQFIQVVHNGIVVQQNVPVTGPTRAAHFEDEAVLGPLMFQGDHGPVAYRNIRMRSLELDHHGTVIGEWQSLDLKNDFDVMHDGADDISDEELFEAKGSELRAMYNWNRVGAAPEAIYVSKKRYSNYDIEFELLHGKRAFEPGLDGPMNAGFLYHIPATTPVWPPCLEMQGRKTRKGIHFSILWVNAMQLDAAGNLKSLPELEYSYGAPWREDLEKENVNLFRIEVREDRAKYFLNNQQVNELQGANYGGMPITAGFIAFQAEFAEATYRNIRIRQRGLY